MLQGNIICALIFWPIVFPVCIHEVQSISLTCLFACLFLFVCFFCCFMSIFFMFMHVQSINSVTVHSRGLLSLVPRPFPTQVLTVCKT